MGKIRVGMIRCDLHAIYYGALMSRFDVEALKDSSIAMGAHFYFHTHYKQRERMTVPRLPVFEITRVYDEDRRRAENMGKIFLSRPIVCDRPEQCCEDVDLVFIADCNGDGSDHLALATPSIKKGVPTFIDKPLSFDVGDARKIVRLAQRHGTPILSLSMLREVPQARLFRRRFAEIAPVEFAVIKASGSILAGQIHGISLAQQLFGPGVKAVSAMGPGEIGYLHLDYGKARGKPEAGVLIANHSGGTPHCATFATAYSRKGAIHSGPIGDFEYPYGAHEILKKIRRLVRTGKSVEPYGHMVENIAVAAAGRLAQKKGRQVSLTEV
ncbi:MAG: Gfo/Idh/MocA family oxidoreductase [Planctomycetota bacterium]